MRKIWAADSETDPFKKGRLNIEAFILGAYDGENYVEFETIDEFVKYFEHKKVIIYFHNGGKFDYHLGFLDYLDSFEPLTVIAGRIAKFKIGEAEYRDSYNILPVPLKAGGEKMEFDYSKMEREVRHKHMAEIKTYLKQDCVALYNMLDDFISLYGSNLTLASTALKTWSKIADRKAPTTNRNFYSEIAPFYYGGRVEARKKGIIKGAFSVVDINSAYPYAMLHEHPISTEFNVDDELPEKNIEQSFIHLKGVSKGALPYRAEDGSLLFPDDNIEREYCVTGWEYLTALECNSLEVSEIIEVLTFDEHISFGNYVNHFYNMKKQAKVDGDKSAYLHAKLFLNSLYGKFGANPENYNEYIALDKDLASGAEIDGYKFATELENVSIVTRPLDENKHRYYNAATAASITGFVRAYLFKAMYQCGLKNVLYCDTDSIATSKINGVEIGTELGQWEVEAECSEGAIAGKKLYAFKNKKKHKGKNVYKIASKGARLNHKEIYSLAKGNTLIFEPEAPTFSLRLGRRFVDRTIKMT